MPVLPDSLTLHDGGVVLRDWREEDAPALEPVCGDDDVCRFTTLPRTYTPSAAADRVRRIHDHRSSGTAVGLAITRRESHEAGGRSWDMVVYSVRPPGSADGGG